MSSVIRDVVEKKIDKKKKKMKRELLEIKMNKTINKK